MNRKNFITTIGLVTGGTLTGFGRPANNETLSEKFYSEIKKIDGCEALSPEEREYRSSMITFRIPGKSLNDVTGAMSKNNIRVRPVGEADLNGVRVSFHLYNDQNDLDKAVESIKNFNKK